MPPVPAQVSLFSVLILQEQVLLFLARQMVLVPELVPLSWVLVVAILSSVLVLVVGEVEIPSLVQEKELPSLDQLQLDLSSNLPSCSSGLLV